MEDIKIYFNWSLNALMPVNTGAADHYLKEHKDIVLSVARKLLHKIDYKPSTIYRGIVLKEEVSEIVPHKNYQYLSFSTDIAVANHFADPINGFGNGVIDIQSELGSYGYIIEHTPKIDEVLFHHEFLSMLPYTQCLYDIGMDGQCEVDGLMKQKEVMILQPTEPFIKIKIYERLFYSLQSKDATE